MSSVLTADPVDSLKRSDRYFRFSHAILFEEAGESAADQVAGQTAVVILNPMCLAAGRGQAALDALGNEGFSIVHGQLFRYSEELITRLWYYQLETFRPDRWRLILDVLLCGPALLIVARGPSDPSGGPAASQMKALKGPSNPAEGQPHHLRVRLGGMNKVVNLIHSSDTTTDVIRELGVLLAPDQLRLAWRRAVRAEPASAEKKRRWLACAPASGTPYGLSYAHINCLIRWRALETLAPEPSAERGSPDRTGAGAGDPRSGWGRGAAARLEADLEFLAELSPAEPLRALALYRERFRANHRQAELPDGPVADVVRELENALLHGRCDDDLLWDACARGRVFVADHERTVVATQHMTWLITETEC